MKGGEENMVGGGRVGEAESYKLSGGEEEERKKRERS